MSAADSHETDAKTQARSAGLHYVDRSMPGIARRRAGRGFAFYAPDGRLESVLTEEQVPGPNGLCLSPDIKTLYMISTVPDPGGDRKIRAFAMVNARPRNGRVFCDMTLEGQRLVPDGMKADVFGNLWCGSTGPYGLCGVFCYSPGGKLLGQIRLPHGVSNLTFGGLKQNEFYMCAAGSLYRVMLNTQSAALC
ncbi:SMP-30/gluconolactonase/LRE family protein [Gluconobacter potus]|uniref:SMP-30/gluconolactonase/LRE family protein n=1 Tax=Gluconobacter potus TaxID=2724927 RepID=UPI0039ED06A5